MSVSTEKRRDFIGEPNVATCRERREYSESGNIGGNIAESRRVEGHFCLCWKERQTVSFVFVTG